MGFELFYAPCRGVKFAVSLHRHEIIEHELDFDPLENPFDEPVSLSGTRSTLYMTLEKKGGEVRVGLCWKDQSRIHVSAVFTADFENESKTEIKQFEPDLTECSSHILSFTPKQENSPFNIHVNICILKTDKQSAYTHDLIHKLYISSRLQKPIDQFLKEKNEENRSQKSLSASSFEQLKMSEDEEMSTQSSDSEEDSDIDDSAGPASEYSSSRTPELDQISVDSAEEAVAVEPKPLLNIYPEEIPAVPTDTLYHCYRIVEMLRKKPDIKITTDLGNGPTLDCSKSILSALSPIYDAYWKKPTADTSNVHCIIGTGNVLRQLVEFVYTGRVGPFTNMEEMAELMIYALRAEIKMLSHALMLQVNTTEQFPCFFSAIRKLCVKRGFDKARRLTEAYFAKYLCPKNFYVVYNLMKDFGGKDATNWCINYLKTANPVDRMQVLESDEWEKSQLTALVEELISM